MKTATSTAPDGSYHLEVPAGAYVLTVELTGFTRIARPVAIGAAPCDQTIDFQLALEPRVAASANPTTTAVIRDGSPARFETLSVQTQAAAAASVDPGDVDESAARLLLPPGSPVKDRPRQWRSPATWRMSIAE